jgi:hypothetical protein
MSARLVTVGAALAGTKWEAAPGGTRQRGDPCHLRHAVLLLFGHAFGLRNPPYCHINLDQP